MKNKNLTLVGLLIFLTCTIGCNLGFANSGDVKADKITVLCTSDLQSLTTTFISEYGIQHPDVNFDVKSLTANEFPEAFKNYGGIGFVSEKSDLSDRFDANWKMLVGRDVVVPVINAQNPFLDIIEKQGLSAQKIASIFSHPESQNWGTLLGNQNSQKVKLFITADESVQRAVAQFLQVNQNVIAKIEIKTADEIISAIQNDPLALGFCQLNTILAEGQQEVVSNLQILPIDKNGNGQLEYHEKIYGSLDNFKRGVWIGKYPKALISSVYSVANASPENENVTEFLSWVVTNGQQYMTENGYSELVYNERKSNLDKLQPEIVLVDVNEPQRSASKVIFLIIGIALAGLIVYAFARKARKSQTENVKFQHTAKVLSENSIEIPAGLYFDKTYTWSFMEQDGTVRIGIDDFLQHVTGKFTRVQMKAPGEKVARNEPVLTLIQNGKQIVISAPISGTIKEINDNLVTDPSEINRSPYSKGWVYQIEPSNWLREIQFMRMAENYKTTLKNEFARLKDFLAETITEKNEMGQIVFQEGGELHDQVLSDLGPQVWEDFQKNFINTAELR